MSKISESEIPFPRRKGNLHIIQYIRTLQNKNGTNWMNRIYRYMTPFVSKSPRSAYLNFRDIDLGRTKKYTSYLEAEARGSKYFKDNFKFR